jgi:hypothetical protein
MQPNVDLAPDYYLTNFKILLEFVVDKYQAILSREEQEFFRRFIQLEEDAQKLLTRCYMRKGTLFRLDKMKYSEIRDLHRALALLYEAKLVSPYEWQNENLAISLFSKSELIALFEKPKGSSRVKD